MYPKRLLVLSIILLNFGMLLYIRSMLIPYVQIPWDEATFLLRALKLHDLMREGHLVSVLANVFDQWQFSYPPIQELLLAITTVPLPFTLTVAKLANASWLCVSSVLLVALHLQSNELHKWNRSLYTIIFFVTSPLILLFGAIAMKETIGTTITLATVLSYLHAKKTQKITDTFKTSFWLSLLFLTKYQYVIIPILAFSIDTVIDVCIQKNKRQNLMRFCLTLAPLLLVVLLWVFFPVNHSALFIALMTNKQNYTGGLAPLSDYLLFHPRALLYMYAPSVLFGALFISSLVMSIPLWKKPLLRISLLLSWIAVGSSTLHYTNIQERYILPYVPFIMILSANMLNTFLVACTSLLKHEWIKRTGALLCVLVLAILVKDIAHSIKTIYAIGSIALKGPAFAQPDYKDIWFSYDEKNWPSTQPWELRETPLDVVRFVAGSVDPKKPYWIYGISGYFPPELFAFMFATYHPNKSTSTQQFDKYAITVRVLPESVFMTKDFVMFSMYQQPQVIAYTEHPMGTLIAKKEFKSLHIEAAIYGEMN